MKRRAFRVTFVAVAVVAIALVSWKIITGKQEAGQRRANIPRVVVAPVTLDTIERVLRYSGDVLPARQAGVFAKVNGTLERVLADIGDRVGSGQLLARIDTTELAQQYRLTAATFENAASNYARTKELADENLVSRQDLDNADAAFKVARANFENARTRLGYASITAPFSGYITKRSLDPGAVVTASNATLFTLMDLDVVKVLINVLERDIPSFSRGMRATVTVDAHPGRRFEGVITRFGEAFDLATRTMAVEVDIRNREHTLKGGMYATVEVVVETRAGVLTVPTEALVKEQEGYAVYAVEKGTARRVPVTCGAESNHRTEILAGLREQQTVITAGQALVKDGGPVLIPR